MATLLVLADLAAGKNCTATQKQCKPSCNVDAKKDSLGNTQISLVKLCSWCKCKACDKCRRLEVNPLHGHDDPARAILQHAATHQKASMKRAAKSAKAVIKSKKPKAAAKKKASPNKPAAAKVSSSSKPPKIKHKKKAKRPKKLANATSAVASSSSAASAIAAGESQQQQQQSSVQAYADYFGQGLLAISLGVALLFGLNVFRRLLCDKATAPRQRGASRLVMVGGKPMQLNFDPLPVVSPDEPGSPR